MKFDRIYLCIFAEILNNFFFFFFFSSPIGQRRTFGLRSSGLLQFRTPGGQHPDVQHPSTLLTPAPEPPANNVNHSHLRSSAALCKNDLPEVTFVASSQKYLDANTF